MGWVRSGIFVMTMALGGVFAGLGADAMLRGRGSLPADQDAAPASFGALRLVVPAAYLRTGGSPGHRLDLLLRHPDLGPAGGAPVDLGRLVFLSISNSDGGLDPAERAQELYGRFLEADAWQNPGGLLLRRFQAGSPYEDEELYLSAPDGRAFTARCRKRLRSGDRGAEIIAETCIWRFRRDGADLQVRFSPDLLPEWETLTEGVARRIDEWTARPARP